MNNSTDDYTRSIESVYYGERRYTYPIPLKVADRRELFEVWCQSNSLALHEIEMTALAIQARGLHVSTKYLIEKQRYEGSYKLVPVPFIDDAGTEHVYAINNSDSPLLARWLHDRHPDMSIVMRHSMFDDQEG